jgi:protoheme IX farnesyltransferase
MKHVKIRSAIYQVRAKYWPLLKSLQTILLLVTGIAGYLSAHPAWPAAHPADGSPALLLGLAGSLFLSIGGSTVLNMWYDRDIDAIMKRTCTRPLAAQLITPQQALRLGLVMSVLGVGWALLLAPLYGLVVFAGLFFDVIVYTLWLKRRSPWSIAWGGISGGMPVLAGRALATGQIDAIGILLTLAILFWIPTHILTFNMRYFDDYQAARIPTFASAYGFAATRLAIALSSVLAAAAMGLAACWVGASAGALHFMAVLGAGLLVLALTSLARPSNKMNFTLFKYASLYMLGAMVVLALS